MCGEVDNVLYIRCLSSNQLEALLNGKTVVIREQALSDMYFQ